MTEDQLTAIAARAEAATEGPWEIEPSEYDADRINGIYYGGYAWQSIVKTDSGVYPPDRTDAEFIASARTDVPALAAEVRALKSLLRDTKTLFEGAEWQSTYADYYRCVGCSVHQDVGDEIRHDPDCKWVALMARVGEALK